MHRPPLSHGSFVAARLGRALLAMLACSAAAAAAAQACEDRLRLDLADAALARSGAYLTRLDDVARRTGEVELARLGLTASVGVRPSLGVGHDLAPEDGLEALDLIGYQFDAAFGYRYDEVAILRAGAALLTAEARLEAQRRTDVLDALLAMSRLRVAERAEAAAAAELLTFQAALERAEQTAVERAADPDREPYPGTPQPDAEAVPPFLREARLQLRRAELDLDDAAAATALQRAGLAALGASAPARAGDLCALTPMALPEPGRLAAREALAQALLVAEALLERAWWAPVRDLKLEAHYQEGGGRATASVGVAAGRPNAEVALRWRPSGNDTWRVQLSANLRLDESMGAAVRSAEAAVAAATAELAAFDAAYPGRLAAAGRAAERAWVEVELLDEALQLAAIKLADPAEARNVARNELAVSRALDARERGLQAYYRAHAAYLAVAEAGW